MRVAQPAPSRDVIYDLIHDHSNEFWAIGADGAADAIWKQVSQWIGDAQASEFKVGYQAGWSDGWVGARETYDE